jgi:hypothetical protein
MKFSHCHLLLLDLTELWLQPIHFRNYILSDNTLVFCTSISAAFTSAIAFDIQPHKP